LAAAGTFTLADTARLLRTRGRAMQAATPVGVGAMAALLGLDYAEAVEVAKAAAQGEVCEAANDNAPGQVVVSGNRAAVERAVELAKEKGAKRAVLLPVSAPFHCALMQPAAEVMREALAAVPMKAPSVPLIANVTATPVSDPAAIRHNLVKQVTGTVRWRECIGYLAGENVAAIAELGAGKVLTGLNKRMAPNARCIAVGTPDEIAQAAEALRKPA
jgi:[acyl-carrier-protein] S-malonyltransferase